MELDISKVTNISHYVSSMITEYKMHQGKQGRMSSDILCG